MRLRSRLITALVALSVACSSVLPQPAYAAGDLTRARARIADIKKDLQKTGRAYLKARTRMEDTEDRIAAVDRSIVRTRGQLARARRVLAVHVATIYRSGGAVEYIGMLLESGSLDQMLNRLEFMRRIGQADSDAIDRVLTLSAKLRAQREKLDREKRTYAKDIAAHRKERDRLQKRLKQQQARYDSLLADLPAPVRQAVSRSNPKGPRGLVFPVAGVCYYSDTWGAARSGGRSHKGTDIMASRGVPVVAIASGTVSSRSGGLGGRAIWLSGSNGWQFYYAHLDSFAVTSGYVHAGQVIGYVGDSGNARGGATHLHFEIHPGGGGAVDPYPYLRACE